MESTSPATPSALPLRPLKPVEQQLLDGQLQPGETVLASVVGHWDQSVVCTDRRIFLLKSGEMAGGSSGGSVRYEDRARVVLGSDDQMGWFSLGLPEAQVDPATALRNPQMVPFAVEQKPDFEAIVLLIAADGHPDKIVWPAPVEGAAMGGDTAAEATASAASPWAPQPSAPANNPGPAVSLSPPSADTSPWAPPPVGAAPRVAPDSPPTPAPPPPDPDATVLAPPAAAVDVSAADLRQMRLSTVLLALLVADVALFIGALTGRHLTAIVLCLIAGIALFVAGSVTSPRVDKSARPPIEGGELVMLAVVVFAGCVAGIVLAVHS